MKKFKLKLYDFREEKDDEFTVYINCKIRIDSEDGTEVYIDLVNKKGYHLHGCALVLITNTHGDIRYSTE